MDYGRKVTDEQLKELEKKIRETYNIQLKEVNDYFKNFSKIDNEMKKRLERGEINEKQYKKWKREEIERSKKYKKLRQTIAEKMTNADIIAANYINDDMPRIYTFNRNYSAFCIEDSNLEELGINFSLVDESTVRRLIEADPNLLPNFPTKRAIDTLGNINFYQNAVSKQVLSGILLGEANDLIALRIMREIPNLGRTSAIRAARTATTSAENGGRLDTYTYAENLGIRLKKQWVSTHDSRTRLSHALADGQVVDVSKPFDISGSKLMCPGDNNGRPEEIYNCRCTMISVINGHQYYNPNEERSFKKWQKQKQNQQRNNNEN